MTLILRTSGFAWFLGIAVFFSCSQAPTRGFHGRSPEGISYSDKPSVLQGLTTDRSIELSVVVETFAEFNYRLEPISGGAAVYPKIHDRISKPFSPWAVERIRFEGLAPEARYYFRILDSNGTLVDERIATTRSLIKDSARIAIVSCASDHVDETNQRTIWKELSQKRPDYLLMIGDNVYADYDDSGPAPIRSEEALWNRYVESRKRIEWYRQKELVPTLAIWDDHDTGRNNANRHTPTLDYARSTFFAFFPQSPAPGVLEPGPGLSFRFNAFGAEFYFLDNRSYRSENGSQVADETHFGEATEKWFFSSQAKASRPAWIISGDQFFGAYHGYESYEGNHPRSFARFVSALRRTGRPFWFVSGDRHLTELQRIERPVFGFQTYELTTSPVHAVVFENEWIEKPNTRQIAGAFGTWNFAIVEMQARAQKLDLNIESWGLGGKLLFRKNLQIVR